MIAAQVLREVQVFNVQLAAIRPYLLSSSLALSLSLSLSLSLLSLLNGLPRPAFCPPSLPASPKLSTWVTRHRRSFYALLNSRSSLVPLGSYLPTLSQETMVANHRQYLLVPQPLPCSRLLGPHHHQQCKRVPRPQGHRLPPLHPLRLRMSQATTVPGERATTLLPLFLLSVPPPSCYSHAILSFSWGFPPDPRSRCARGRL